MHTTQITTNTLKTLSSEKVVVSKLIKKDNPVETKKIAKFK